MISKNPYTNQVIEEHAVLSNRKIDEAIQTAQDTYLEWRQTSFEDRASVLLRVAEILRSEKDTFAQHSTEEMGKPISQSIDEIEKCAWVCEYYAKYAKSFLADETIKTDAYHSYVRYEPLGVILAVMPWNYPFWQVFRFAAPTLMAGNVGVLKHASNVQRCAQDIQYIFEKAGCPKGSFLNLPISGDQVKSVLENPIVKAATLTGSYPAGSSVASIAGKHIKKTVLELGGSNALIVFPDAHLDTAIDTCIQARFQNTGQSCIAGKRLLLHESIHDIFVEKVVEKVKNLKVGDPMDPDTFIGVMARDELAEELQEQVDKSLAKGAKCLVGGTHKNAFFKPTVLVDVTSDMAVFTEETFGPVLTVTRFSTENEAIRLSNTNEFGLGVSIFTQSDERVHRMLPNLEEGAVFVNDLVKSDPRLPFGGIKSSGYGRELSHFGIKEFVNIKTVYMKTI